MTALRTVPATHAKPKTAADLKDNLPITISGQHLSPADKKRALFVEVLKKEFIRELQYLWDVANKRAQARDTFTKQLVDQFTQVIPKIFPGAEDVVNAIGAAIDKKADKIREERTKTVANLTDELDLNRLSILMDVVAQEALRRYESFIVDCLGDDDKEGVIPFAKVGARRMLEHLSRSGEKKSAKPGDVLVPLSESNLLVGLIEGRSGSFIEGFKNNELTLKFTKKGKKKPEKIDAEDVYARSGMRRFEVCDGKLVDEVYVREKGKHQEGTKWDKFKGLVKGDTEALYNFGYVKFRKSQKHDPKAGYMVMPMATIQGRYDFRAQKKNELSTELKLSLNASSLSVMMVDRATMAKYLAWSKQNPQKDLRDYVRDILKYPLVQTVACEESLEGLDLRGAKLSHVNLSGAVLKDIAGADLSHSYLIGTTIAGDAKGANFNNARCEFMQAESVDFSGCDCTQTIFSYANIAKAKLINCETLGAIWVHTNTTGIITNTDIVNAQKAQMEKLQKEIELQREEFRRAQQEAMERMAALERKFDKADPHYTVAEKILKLRDKVLHDPYIESELTYYVAPNGEREPGLGDHQPLQEWVQENLLDAKAEARILLLQGQAGAGKSTFNRHLLKQLWQDQAWDEFQPGRPAPRAFLPIFIPLGLAQVDPKKLLDYLRDLPEITAVLTDAEINVLKTDYQVLLVADGYDEMPGNQRLNLYDVNQLNQYDGRIKLLIGCRTQRAQELKEDTCFTPHDQQSKPQHELFKCRHVTPFNETQIHDYLTKYLARNKDRTDILLWKDAKQYEEQFAQIKELRDLITTPFLLLMSVEILPSMVTNADAKSDDLQKLTRAKLYDHFMEKWFERQTIKAQKSADTTAPKILMKQYQKFCFDFARGLNGANVTCVQYPFGEEELEGDLYDERPKQVIDPKGPRGPWVKKLLGVENEATLRARKGAPLIVATGNYYQFIHASLIDYFYMTFIYKEKSEVSLQQRLMTKDQWHLLADRIKADEDFKNFLFAMVEKSKMDQGYAIAAANAITILNIAGVNFCDMDFRGIKIPGADLSSAILDGTNFAEADLSNVNLQGAWLRNAHLTRAKVPGLRFGELPFIQMNDSVQACVYSPDGQMLAIASGKIISLYNAVTRKEVRVLQGHTEGVTSVSWDAQAERIASGGYDNSIRVWDVVSGKELHILHGHTGTVQCVAWNTPEPLLELPPLEDPLELPVLDPESRGPSADASYPPARTSLAPPH